MRAIKIGDIQLRQFLNIVEFDEEGVTSSKGLSTAWMKANKWEQEQLAKLALLVAV